MPFLFAMVHHRSDQQLVAAFNRGDKQAFSQLVSRYQAKIYSLCYRRLGETEIATELVQDIFIAVFRALPRFRGDAKFSTWLYRIAVNHCKNKHSYHQRRLRQRHESLTVSPDDENTPKRELPDLRARSDAKTHRGEAADILQQALNLLTPDDRTLVIMREIDELSYDEIAEILTVPRGTIKSRLHRARADLARALSTLISKDDLV